MTKSHFSALLNKHSHIDHEIAAESQRPLPDSRRLAELKKQKLRLKDALTTG